MDIDAIRLIILSAKYLNISQAAEFGISQTAASRKLKQFQEDLHTKLFSRAGRGIKLTDSGRIFLNDVTPLCSRFEELEKRYSPHRNSITIAASYRPSKYLLPKLMTDFSKHHPGAELTLRTRSSLEIEELLLESKIDLAITTNPTVSRASSLVTKPYCREPLTAFIAANHPLIRMKLARASEMITVPVIVKFRREGQSRVEAQLSNLEHEGLKFKTVVRCESPDVVKEFVRHGAGVGFLYYNSVRRGIEQGEFKTIQFPGLDLVGENYIVYSKDKPLSSLAREFLSFLCTSVAKRTSSRLLSGERQTRTV